MMIKTKFMSWSLPARLLIALALATFVFGGASFAFAAEVLDDGGSSGEPGEYDFSLAGELESKTPTTAPAEDWVVNGLTFSVPDATLYPDIAVGDLIEVWGNIAEDGTWVAEVIEEIDNTPTSTYTGTLDFMDVVPGTWVVDGLDFLVDELTVVDPAVVQGGAVVVTFEVTDEGDFYALMIDAAAEVYEFALFGVLESKTPTTAPAETWVVNGVPFSVLDATLYPDIVVGDLLKVWGTIADDGTWVAELIEEVDTTLVSTYTGTLEFIDPVDGLAEGEYAVWLVDTLEFLVDGETLLDMELAEGDTVLVTYVVNADGDFYALSIEKVSEPEPTATPTLTPKNENNRCQDDPAIHVQAAKVAAEYAEYGATPENVQDYFCKGYGFGEIKLAFKLSAGTEYSAYDLLQMRSEGMGWGLIKQMLDGKDKPGKDDDSDDDMDDDDGEDTDDEVEAKVKDEDKGKPEDTGKPEKTGKPDKEPKPKKNK